jgi:hypothetical protein
MRNEDHVGQMLAWWQAASMSFRMPGLGACLLLPANGG